KIALILRFWPAEALTRSIQLKTSLPIAGAAFMFTRISIPLQGRKYNFWRCEAFALACVAGILLLLAKAGGQSRPTGLELYAEAMKQPQIDQQITGLEHFLAVAENGYLKQDALEVLIWDYVRMGRVRQAQQRADQHLQSILFQVAVFRHRE